MAEGMVIEEAETRPSVSQERQRGGYSLIPIKALQMIIGIFVLINPVHREMAPRPATPPMNTLSMSLFSITV